MKTIQMTLDASLVLSVDRAVQKLKTTRSAFTREALREALKTLASKELDRKHRAGYAKKPIKKGEFDGWESEQQWGDS
jgi:metal-responsive CopG/Arc/MetJ family transcriptional regulator